MILHQFTQLFIELIFGHAVADFALQSRHNNRMKNRHKPEGQNIWFMALMAHSLVNGAAVYVITGVLWMGIAETICHACIDFGKCENWYPMWVDQLGHIWCKILWTTLTLTVAA